MQRFSGNVEWFSPAAAQGQGAGFIGPIPLVAYFPSGFGFGPNLGRREIFDDSPETLNGSLPLRPGVKELGSLVRFQGNVQLASRTKLFLYY